jgi:hypothetical protein
MVMGVGRSLLDFDSPAKQRLRIGKPTLLQPNEAQMINRFEVARVRSEHDIVKLLRVPQSPLRIECSSPLKSLERINSSALQQQ